MDLPSEVLIHNALLGMKGKEATLLQIHPEGYYELNCRFGEKIHRLCVPISETVLILQSPEDLTVSGTVDNIER